MSSFDHDVCDNLSNALSTSLSQVFTKALFKRRQMLDITQATFITLRLINVFASFNHILLPHRQIEYDPGFMYDVSLQIESEFNEEIKSIVPAEHKKHRHK